MASSKFSEILLVSPISSPDSSVVTAHAALHPLNVQGHATPCALHDAALLSLQIFGCATGVSPSAADTSGKVPADLAKSLSRLKDHPTTPRQEPARTPPHTKSPLDSGKPTQLVIIAHPIPSGNTLSYAS